MVEVAAIRKANGDVYIKVDDLIKSLYNDFTQIDEREGMSAKEYITEFIENWEAYQMKIRKRD